MVNCAEHYVSIYAFILEKNYGNDTCPLFFFLPMDDTCPLGQYRSE